MSADLLATLTWLAGAGSAVVGAALVSWLAEHNSAFQAWSPDAKLGFQVAASVLIALAAFVIVRFVPPDTLAQLAPYWTIVFTSVVAALGNQLWHKVTKDKPRDTSDW